MSRKILGIDLGTTNSCVAYSVGGKPKIVENAEGKRITASIIAFTMEEGKPSVVIGDAAKRQAYANPKNTISAVKRLIGKTYESVKHLADKLSYEVVPGSNGKALIKCGGKTITPEEVSGRLLAEIVQQAEKALGNEKITEVVITVPAHFDDAQRQATKDAGKIAGLEVLRIINEPTAAAMAYGIEKDTNGIILVFDLGGGTFDVTILEIENKVYEVRATGGDTALGGEDFDNILVKYAIDEFMKEHKIDLSKDSVALYRIKEAAKAAKETLSSQQSATITVPFIAEGPKHMGYTVSRAMFEQAISKFVDKAISKTQDAIKESGVPISEISKVVLVGGSTRIPLVIQRIKALFNKDPYADINPDEAVALGAAIQGGIIAGDVSDIVLLDVSPLDLGIESMGGLMAVIVEKNTTIPTSKTKIFTTIADNQPEAVINIYQGNRKHVKDNRLLGTFKLIDIQKAPRGVPQIEVEFRMDVNGIIEVSAHDKSINKKQNVVLTPESNLSKEEIQRLTEEAEASREEDEKLEKKILAKNEFTSTQYECSSKLENVEPKETKENLSNQLNTIIQEAATKEKEDVSYDYSDSNTKIRELLSEIYKNSKSPSPDGNKGGENTPESSADSTASPEGDKPITPEKE